MSYRRVGFHEPEEKGRIALPVTVEELEQLYEVSDKTVTAPPYGFLWDVVAEEGREKQFVHQAFISDVEDMPYVAGYPSDDGYVADAALKMTLGTPNEDYDPEVASHLLHSIGEQSVQTATTQLLARGVLSKTVRNPQLAKPGRTLKISDRYAALPCDQLDLGIHFIYVSNQNALGGAMSADLYQDAAALEDMLNQGDVSWREWPLVANDGDVAALIELVSSEQVGDLVPVYYIKFPIKSSAKVEFQVDTTQAQSARANIDWNSKKAGWLNSYSLDSCADCAVR